MLFLYKKFGFELMARLTDVVLGTAMEVLPASENKSKIMRYDLIFEKKNMLLNFRNCFYINFFHL